MIIQLPNSTSTCTKARTRCSILVPSNPYFERLIQVSDQPQPWRFCRHDSHIQPWIIKSVMRLHNLLQVGDQPQPPGSIGTHTSDLESAVDDVPPQQVGPSAHSHPTSSTLHLCSCSTLDPILKQSYLSGCMAICTRVPTVDCGLGSRALPNASVFIQVLHRQTNTTPLDSLSPRCNTCVWACMHTCIQAPSWDDTSCRKTSLN